MNTGVAVTNPINELKSSPTVWILRSGAEEERDSWALANGHGGGGWDWLPDITAIASRDELGAIIRKHHPAKAASGEKRHASELWAIRFEISVGDIVVMPRTRQNQVALGVITAEYSFDDKATDATLRHRVGVDWRRSDVSRSGMSSDLRDVMDSRGTVFKPSAYDAQYRFRALLESGVDPGPRPGRVPRSLSLLKSREAVERSMAEFREIGRVAFLAKYGFGKSRKFLMEYDGEVYDSKAIAGAAFGYQYPSEGPLLPSEFSGGIAETVKVLTRLGFTFLEAKRGPSVGNLFTDRKTISLLFGGEQQRGITRFRDEALALFSNGRGRYSDDEPTSERPFVYRGEAGKSKDSLSQGNRMLLRAHTSGEAIRFWRHQSDGGIRFMFWAVVVGFETAEASGAVLSSSVDVDWILMAVESPDGETWPAQVTEALAVAANRIDSNLAHVRAPIDYQAACEMLEQKGNKKRSTENEQSQRSRNRYERRHVARRAVLARTGTCESNACTGMPPDIDSLGAPILEVDHVVPLHRGGADHPMNMIAVCPNCHSAKTRGQRAAEWEKEFKRIAQRLHTQALRVT